MAEHQLPKLNTGVRFPSPAPKKESSLCGCFPFFRMTGNRTLRGSERQENVPVVRF